MNDTKLARAHARFGWTLLALALLAGTALEGLLGYKSPRIMLDPLARELWSLAHFHAALLALVNLVYAPYAEKPKTRASQASRALRIGSVLLPLGFFLGGIAHPEGDPSIGIFLVPLGAVLVIYAALAQVIAARQP